MATHIELNVIIDPNNDPYEKTSPKLFNKSMISGDVEYDHDGRLWFDYEGKRTVVMCKYDDFKAMLLE